MAAIRYPDRKPRRQPESLESHPPISCQIASQPRRMVTIARRRACGDEAGRAICGDTLWWGWIVYIYVASSS